MKAKKRRVRAALRNNLVNRGVLLAPLRDGWPKGTRNLRDVVPQNHVSGPKIVLIWIDSYVGRYTVTESAP